MTHSDVVNRASKWLKEHSQNIIVPNCNTVAIEVTSATPTGEIPDVIGWCSWTSVLIEVKVSRADFLKDKKKKIRKEPNKGMGELRFYACPVGLIKEKELPENWGLLYVGENKITIEKKAEKQESNLNSERTLLLSLNRRINKLKIGQEEEIKLIFKNKEGVTFLCKTTLKKIFITDEETFFEDLEDVCTSSSCNNESQNFCDCGSQFENYEFKGIEIT